MAKSEERSTTSEVNLGQENGTSGGGAICFLPDPFEEEAEEEFLVTPEASWLALILRDFWRRGGAAARRDLGVDMPSLPFTGLQIPSPQIFYTTTDREREQFLPCLTEQIRPEAECNLILIDL